MQTESCVACGGVLHYAQFLSHSFVSYYTEVADS